MVLYATTLLSSPGVPSWALSLSHPAYRLLDARIQAFSIRDGPATWRPSCFTAATLQEAPRLRRLSTTQHLPAKAKRQSCLPHFPQEKRTNSMYYMSVNNGCHQPPRKSLLLKPQFFFPGETQLQPPFSIYQSPIINAEKGHPNGSPPPHTKEVFSLFVAACPSIPSTISHTHYCL